MKRPAVGTRMVDRARPASRRVMLPADGAILCLGVIVGAWLMVASHPQAAIDGPHGHGTVTVEQLQGRLCATPISAGQLGSGSSAGARPHAP
jgi:hypothetical protein